MFIRSSSAHVHDRLLFVNDTATTEIYTLSLHDALPISPRSRRSLAPTRSPKPQSSRRSMRTTCGRPSTPAAASSRSEEHTSELQSRQYLVCRLLLEKKKSRDSRGCRHSCERDA